MKLVAYADSYHLVTCVISEQTEDITLSFWMDKKELHILDSFSEKNQTIYHCYSEDEIDLEQDYLVTCDNLSCSLFYRFIVKEEKFDQEYAYKGELGSIYQKDKTIFRLWAPTSRKAILKLWIEENLQEVEMIKENGVFSCLLNGDFENARYHYLTYCNGEYQEFVDPYSYGLSINGEYSIVTNWKKYERLESFHNTDVPILYECSIRDFTSDEDTSILNKGKYLGLVEEESISYLKDLGITHLQVMPTTMIGSIDENHIEDSYNWGYDPISYTTLEGSYSTDINNPYARIEECRQMVSILHKNNIGIIFDVVYNHTYCLEKQAFAKAVPYYYYRYDGKGKLTNGSGCGNDMDSQKKMVRHLLVASLHFYLDVLGADGFRFDLMGLLDIETVKLLYLEAKKEKDDILFYGEGWNMETGLKKEERTSLYNIREDLPIGYFNDSFRDICRGTFDFRNGYLTDDASKAKEMLNAFCGGVLNDFPGNSFLDYHQSINYIECHDNLTLYDCLKRQDENEQLSMWKSCVSALLFSFGIPLLHSGVEYQRSKNGLDNTYNAGDDINHFSYKQKEEKKEFVSFVKEAIQLRKECSIYHLSNQEFKENLSYQLVYDTTIKVFVKTVNDSIYEEFYFIMNPHDFGWEENFDEKMVLLWNEDGRKSQEVSSLFVSSHSIVLLGKVK